MDARAKTKALFRAKLNAQKQEKQRIDSPLVRYNELDQLICRVCDVIIKSEALWPAHQASRKHHEAIDQLKANAAVVNRTNVGKHEPGKNIQKSKPDLPRKPEEKTERPTAQRSNGSSSLPPDFFDSQGTKRTKFEENSKIIEDSISRGKDYESTQFQETNTSGNETDEVLPANIVQTTSREYHTQVSGKQTKIEVGKQSKGPLPEGFFDNKDADLRARGVALVKLDVKNEYKEFEKLIKEDLQQVDERLEEEEFDAAEMIEEEETVEQRAYKERVELLRRKKLELRASKAAASPKVNNVKMVKASSDDESSSDEDEDDQNFRMNWRAKRI